jgi:hypothetical protein
MSDHKRGPTFQSQQIRIDGQQLRQNVGNVIRSSGLETGEIWHRDRTVPVQRKVSERYWVPQADRSFRIA